ncbi:MAG: CDP-alcohol phosphatidyltransferase family protein [Planctomycetota bacterium]|nr:CDP-alcohol phosphatidyltransferase family protein [Planctomycetota bacterium]
MKNYQIAERRPIASRKLAPIKWVVDQLVRLKISPNFISMTSIAFSLCGAGFILATESTPSSIQTRLLWLAAAVFVQLRLLANLFDGMVAMKSGKASLTGELFNEIPDRISDSILLIALGFVSGSSPHLGYLAALLAMASAYLRAIGASVGAGQVFNGIMAKPQRMFVITVLFLFLSLAPKTWSALWESTLLGPTGISLIIICLGCSLTIVTRLRAILGKIEEKTNARIA